MRNTEAATRPIFSFNTDITANTKLADTVFLMTVGVLLSWSLTSSIISNTVFEQQHLGNLAATLAVTAALRLAFHNKYVFAIVLSVLALALSMFAWEYVVAEYTSEALISAMEFIAGAVNFAAGTVPHTMAYERAITWAIISGMSLFVVLFCYLRFSFFALLSVSVLVMGVSLNYGFFIYSPAFYAFALCVLAVLIRHLQTGKNVRASAGSYFALYAMPAVVVCILAAFAMPKPQEGFAENMATTLVTTPVERMTTAVHAAFRPKHFSLAQTGFGAGATRLGGDVVLNDDVIMRIRADGPLYLTGNILDTYTGYAWVNNFGGEMMPFGYGRNIGLYDRVSSVLLWLIMYADVQEGWFEHRSIPYFDFLTNRNIARLALMGAIRGDTVHDYGYRMISTEEFTVSIGNFRTFSAFYSGIPSAVYGVGRDIGFLQDAHGTIMSEALMPRNTYYRVVHHDLAPMFDTYLLANISRRGVLNDMLLLLEWDIRENSQWGSVIFRSETSEDVELYAELLRNYLIPHADWVYEVYTQLPEHFPQRVRLLAEAITAEARTDFERALLLERHLQRFRYTLSPGPTPPYRDFVDYFLFDLQAGYCTSFASAFVTMARSIGLPARYVEGFNVQAFPDQYGYIDVSNEFGHAWGEVYFEGFGWKKFEPTPGGGGVQEESLAGVIPVSLPWDDGMLWDDFGWMYGPDFNPGWQPEDVGAGTTQAHEAAASVILGRIMLAALYVAL
ncbi:MAG: DUF3488 and transglutaminase-like domain-containing protein, partial [Defluviitaleaceae bacterium]|nr:DUF3488 and transglutaminase-like domain-containing protein [Defluviitaleaceae bacterium]